MSLTHKRCATIVVTRQAVREIILTFIEVFKLNTLLVEVTPSTSRSAIWKKLTIHVTLSEKRTLYQDLLQFPLLASRITKVTSSSNNVLYCTLTLRLCPNILHFDFYKCSPNRLLDRLKDSDYTLLPKLRDITAGPGDYENTKILLPCRWRHRATITRLTAYEARDFI